MLDSESYKFLDLDIIFDKVKVIAEHFKDLLLTNNCCFHHLKEELEILFDHIHNVSKSSAEKCWPIIFRIGDNLGICNLLHILNICLVAVIQCRVRETLLTHIYGTFFSKKRQSLKHDTRNSFAYKVRQRSEQRKV